MSARLALLVAILHAATATATTTAPPPDPDPHCNHGHSGPSPAPPSTPLPRVRPSPENRSFFSPAVERALAALVFNRTWRDPELATLFWNCMPNTLDTTVWQAPNGSDPRAQPHHAGSGPNGASFVSTGDQASMYLRDSQNQVLPYIRYAAEEPGGVGSFLRGVLRRYVDSVLLDPYANSFDFTHADRRCNPGAWTKDNTTERDAATGARVDGMKAGVHQRKWEMDSLASVLKLGRLYHAATADASPFDARWRAAVNTILDTFVAMQQPLSPRNFTSVNYTFQTLTYEPKDTSAHGIGRNHRWTGMIRTSFLPSDDSPRLPYFVPANAFAVVELRGVAALLRNLSSAAGSARSNVGAGDEALAARAEALAAQVAAGIARWGIVTHSSGARIFAMEVDGYGNFFFGDDANVPSLLALPFYGFVDTADTTYQVLEACGFIQCTQCQSALALLTSVMFLFFAFLACSRQATRALLLNNETNPYFYGCGSAEDGCAALGGIGSEDASGNAGLGRVWALSLCTRLLTVDGTSAAADAERLAILKTLRESSGGTGLLHESYWFEDATVFTRFWFAMANSYLGEAILQLAENHPHLLFEDADTPFLPSRAWQQ